MLLDFKNHLNENFPFLQGKKLMIAISGGIDSIVLTHIVHKLNFDISLAHCNFKLRGKESDDDELFIHQLANDLNVKLFTTQFDTQEYATNEKKSIQVAARELRYNWFKELLKNEQLDYIITGHNTNDNLETFLINLSRGTGLEGLTGIPATNGKIARPLLAFSREEILMYAIKNNITWREDKSNASVKYIRNKVRHKVLPILKEINPNLMSSFKNTLQYLNESQLIAQEKIDEISDKIIKKETDGTLKISIKAIQKLSHKKAYLYQILKDFGFTEWNDVVDLLTAQSGKQLFSPNYRLIKDREVLILTKNIETNSEKSRYLIEEPTTEITTPISLKIEDVSKEDEIGKHIIYVDKDLIKFPLVLRKWEYGNAFFPTKMKGSKKISRYFKDSKMSILEKENTWLLVTKDNQIIWIVNKRQDRRFLPTETTKKLLMITFTP